MPVPTVAQVADRAGLKANDPRAVAALDIAMSWARVTLARAFDDALDDLNPTGDDAVLGYAADYVKLPAAAAALLENNDVPSTLPFDVGRRWADMLCRGNKHLWAVR